MPCSISQATGGWTIQCTDGSRRTFPTRAEALAWCRRKDAIPQPDHAEGGVVEDEGGCGQCSSVPAVSEDAGGRCAIDCQACADTCAAAARGAEGALRALLLDCADLSRASCGLQGRASEFAVRLRALCSEACRRCAEACAEAGPAYAAAAEACRRCAASCAR